MAKQPPKKSKGKKPAGATPEPDLKPAIVTPQVQGESIIPQDTVVPPPEALTTGRVLEKPLTEYKNFEFMRQEEATILNDYVRQHYGFVSRIAQVGSGVIMNKDRVLQYQAYNDLVGYDMYDEIDNDPHFYAMLNNRKLAVAGLRWHIVPGRQDDELHKKLCEKIKEMLENLVGWTGDLVELGDAHLKGFSVSEIMWDVDRDGWKVPVDIMNRPQRRFQFDAATRWLKLRMMGNVWLGTPVSPHKFIVHRNSHKYENPFGDALGQKLFWPFIFKRMVLKFWARHCETGSASVPIVQHPAGADPDLKKEAIDVASMIRAGSYGRIPDNFKLLWAMTNNVLQTGEGYERYLKYNDEQVTKCVLGQVLTTEAGGSAGQGSRALGAVHNLVRRDILEYDAKCLAETINDTIIKWIVEDNGFVLDRMPRFEFVLEEEKNLQAYSQAIKVINDAGYVVDPEFIEDELQLPLMRNEADEIISKANTKPPAPAVPFGNPFQRQQQQPGGPGAPNEPEPEPKIPEGANV